MESSAYFELGLVLLAFLGGMLLTRHADEGPIFWLWAWIAQLLIGVLLGAYGRSLQVLTLAGGLAMVFPTFQLAGALRYAERPVPMWLLPLGFGLAVLRGTLLGLDLQTVSRMLSLPLEVAAYLSAAVIVARIPLAGAGIRRLVVVGFVALTFVEVYDGLVEVIGGEDRVEWWLWLAVGIPVGAVQLLAWIEQIRERAATAGSGNAPATRTAEDRFQALTRHSRDVIAELGPDSRFLYVSPNAEEVLGFRPDEVVGQGLAELMARTAAQPVRHPGIPNPADTLGELLAGAPFERLHRITDQQGETRWIEVDASHYYTADGELRVVAVARNVTERVNIEQHLLSSQKLESLGVISAGVAHDFNNLLMGVIGQAELGQAELGAHRYEAIGACFTTITEAAKQAGGLTQQLMTYAGKGSFLMRPVDLAEEIEKAKQLITTAIESRAQLRLDLADGLPAVKADPVQLQQVILNLVTNAVEACAAKSGCVDIATRSCIIEPSDPLAKRLAPGCYLSLEVRDNGHGMDEATRTRVFDPFFSTKFHGHGLGLATVQGIVNAHHGALTVDSTPGVGSTFRVFLPATDEQIESSIPPPQADAREQTTVLVVDDTDATLRYVQKALEQRGFRVVTAQSGHDAVEAYRRRSDDIELALLDLAMPEMSGGDILRALRALRGDLPAIVMSGYSEAMAAEELSDVSFDAFLQKPFRAAELVALVQEVRAAGPRIP
jgi:PAS domain S-box-containing protein